MLGNYKYKIEIFRGYIKKDNEIYTSIRDRKLFCNKNMAISYIHELKETLKKGEELRIYKYNYKKWELINEENI